MKLDYKTNRLYFCYNIRNIFKYLSTIFDQNKKLKQLIYYRRFKKRMKLSQLIATDWTALLVWSFSPMKRVQSYQTVSQEEENLSSPYLLISIDKELSCMAKNYLEVLILSYKRIWWNKKKNVFDNIF